MERVKLTEQSASAVEKSQKEVPNWEDNFPQKIPKEHKQKIAELMLEIEEHIQQVAKSDEVDGLILKRDYRNYINYWVQACL